MDLGILEETVRLSTSAYEAVLYLCNAVSFTGLILRILFPERSSQGGLVTEGVYDLSVLLHDEPPPAAPPLEDGLMLVMDAAPGDSGGGSSHRISSSNSTIRFDAAVQPPSQGIPDELKLPLFYAAGCGCWEETEFVGRRPELRYSTVLDLLVRVSCVLELCVARAVAEKSNKAAALFMDWVCKTGVWKTAPAELPANVMPIICHGKAEAQHHILRVLSSHARRSGVTSLAEALNEWNVSGGEVPLKARMDLSPDSVFVVDPKRMAMLVLAQLLMKFGWIAASAKCFQLTDRHLIKPLLALCAKDNVGVATELFNSIHQLPRIAARFIQDANAEGLEECYKLVCPPEQQSLQDLPSSILSSSTSVSAAQWWESLDTLRTLSHVIRGSALPFTSLLCALVLDDESQLQVALEEAFLLYAVVTLSNGVVSIDLKRRALLTPQRAEQTSPDWCLEVFNVLAMRWLQEDALQRARLLVLRTAAAVQELKLLAKVFQPESEPGCEPLTPPVIWRALLQAARNENDSEPPSLSRYVSPELLADSSTSVAPVVAAFNFLWRNNDAAAEWSWLVKSRVLLTEHQCRLAIGMKPSASPVCGRLELSPPLSRETVLRLDEALLEPTLIANPDSRCREFLFAGLFFLINDGDRLSMCEQIVRASPCLAPSLLLCLWTEERWGELLKEMLVNHCVTSEDSVHVLSVCTLLSALPSYLALDLMRLHVSVEEDPARKRQLALRLLEPPESSAPGCCRTMRGAQLMQHSVGGLLNAWCEPLKLLSLHSGRECMKEISSCPEMSAFRLRLESALTAVYESGKKHLSVLGLALSESVRLQLTDQNASLKEMETKCRKSLVQCLESAKSLDQQQREVCLSNTVCDICADPLTYHSPINTSAYSLERAALQGKVCAMNTCEHRYHALCLRSLTVALEPNRKEFVDAYVNLIKLYEAFGETDEDEQIQEELVKSMQTLVARACPLCTHDLTIAI